jgi:hypothetical protein
VLAGVWYHHLAHGTASLSFPLKEALEVVIAAVNVVDTDGAAAVVSSQHGDTTVDMLWCAAHWHCWVPYAVFRPPFIAHRRSPWNG